MPYYSVTLEWDDRYVVAPVEAENVEAAIAAAYEWANDGGYDTQDTYDDCGETYVGFVGVHETMEDAENAHTRDGEEQPIPFEHRSDGEKLQAVTKVAAQMLAALEAAFASPTNAMNPYTEISRNMRTAIVAAKELGITPEGSS